MTTTNEENKYFQSEPRPPFPTQKIIPPGNEFQMEPPPRFEAPFYKAAGKLAGKKALVTGGDSGIGRSVCVLFAKEGADVGFTFIHSEEIDAGITSEYIEFENRESLSLQTDVTSYEQCVRTVKQFVDRFGKIDILVNNAAYQHHVNDINDLSIEQWDKTFKTNIYGYFYLIKAALPYMEAGSVIINTGSVTGLIGSSSLLDYSATKGAIHTFTKSLAKSLLPRQIRVNCVAPGPVWTPLNPAERVPDETVHFGEKTPYHRPAQPEEIAPTYVYLASTADSSYMSGEVIGLLGGNTEGG